MEKNYPYLGIKHIDDKSYVVLFTEPERGVIVMSNFDEEGLNFGTIGNFGEESFEPLPPDQCVRLSN